MKSVLYLLGGMLIGYYLGFRNGWLSSCANEVEFNKVMTYHEREFRDFNREAAAERN